MENITNTNINNNIFNGGDFVISTGGNGEFISGGYTIASSFLGGDQSLMTTYNGGDQDGGQVSSQFENLAVPAGLFYINTRIKKNNDIKREEHYNNRKTAPDEMIDKLYALVEFDKKRKRKTKKHNIKKNKTNTRKHK
jgi:hypothetical protein